MVMPSAPPRSASTAAATGSGSTVCRACRTVATWSMFTPRRIMIASSMAQRLGQVRSNLAVTPRFTTEDLEEQKSKHEVERLVEQGAHDRDAAARQPEPGGQDQGQEPERQEPRHPREPVARI